MGTRRVQDADYDVVIVGAGFSGINFAYRLQERNPELSYCILEGRHQVGGTWSLFQYPGIRSDSDLYTFGFPWRPWVEKQPIARGPLILNYLEASVAEAGIDNKIKFNHRVVSMDWSSASSTWTLNVTAGGGDDNEVVSMSMRARFVLLGTGYYDYEEPLEARIPGIDSFRGAVVHPQFWPRDLDYSGKNVVVIGSGATAITLLPSMADKAAHITMLQRSPSYILALPENDPLDWTARLLLPAALARRLIRFRWIMAAFLIATLCRWFPRLARAVILWLTSLELPTGTKMKPHFTPRYNPWEQRMCFCPGGDFFQCLRAGKASVETGVIEQVTESTIRIESGRELHPDIIVTATGLKVRLAGGINVSLDGRPVRVPDCYSWKGCMLENLPNLFYSMGYFDASWTLGVDATAQLVCRLLNTVTRDGFAHIVPRLSEAEKSTMSDLPFLPINSTYVERAKGVFPKVGNSKQWLPRSYYWKDLANAWWGDVQSGLEWSR
ncbi:uncharacterized protein [Lolium perenne]|uniref:uncharacterized protein n=1 Tax=Lolium perenne TaxID=4522 RepID=UPI0021EB1812|nr:uncharacterized protein LOC127304693 [Lolium perenne]